MAILAPGTVFATFTIGRLLGTGRHADVYEVVTLEGAHRALKILEEGVSPASKLYARFIQECEIVATLEHVHVVRFFGAGVEQGRIWLLLELVAGRDLERICVEAGGALPVERAVRLVRRACAGVAAAHAIKILHRDIEPGNILVTADDIAKVTDFGSAKIARYGVETTKGARPGEGLFMAPEYLARGVAEERSDVYAMALVLDRAIAGAHLIGPSHLSTYAIVIRRSQYDPPALATLGREDIPGDLSFLVARALAKDLEQRPDMDEMGQELDVVLRHLTVQRRVIARSLPVMNDDPRSAATEPAMAVFAAPAVETGRNAVLPPPSAASTLRSTFEPQPRPAPAAKTLPMEAIDAGERRSTNVPVERPAAAVTTRKPGLGPALAVAGVLVAGAVLTAGWALSGRGGEARAPASDAGPSAAATALAMTAPVVPTVTATASATPAKPAAAPRRPRRKPQSF